MTNHLLKHPPFLKHTNSAHIIEAAHCFSLTHLPPGHYSLALRRHVSQLAGDITRTKKEAVSFLPKTCSVIGQFGLQDLFLRMYTILANHSAKAGHLLLRKNYYAMNTYFVV